MLALRDDDAPECEQFGPVGAELHWLEPNGAPVRSGKRSCELWFARPGSLKDLEI